MTDRENNVYKAKLAEQAERYDGKWWPKKIDFSVVAMAVLKMPKFFFEKSYKTVSNP